MDLLKAVAIIFGFSYFGDFVSTAFNLPVPGSIIGMIALFTSLKIKLVKVSSINKLGDLLQKNMAFLFVPLLVGISLQFNLIKEHWILISTIIFTTTIITYVVVGKVSEKVSAHE